jgi:hypothetical protein
MQLAVFIHNSVDLLQQAVVSEGFDVIAEIAVVTVCGTHWWLRKFFLPRSVEM